MEMPPMPPMPPNDSRYWRAESDYRLEQAKRGGVVSDIAILLSELCRLLFLVISFPPRVAIRWWRKRRGPTARR